MWRILRANRGGAVPRAASAFCSGVCLVDKASDIAGDGPPHPHGPPGEPEDGAHVRLKGGRPRARRSALRRWTRRLVFLAIALALSGGVLAAAFWAALSNGPIASPALGARIAANLDERLGDDYAVRVGAAFVEKGPHGPEFSVADLQVIGRSGEVVFEAPHANVSIGAAGLLTGRLQPRRLEAHGVELRLVVRPDGSLALSAGKDAMLIGAPAPASPGAPPAPDAASPEPDASGAGAGAETTPREAVMRPLAGALRRLLALAVGGGSALSSLERFAVTQGQLVFDDLATGRSIRYSGLEILLDRSGGVASLSVSAQGPSGRWRMRAQARGEEDVVEGLARGLDVDVRDLSATELVLLTGWRAPPVDSDALLSARLAISLNAAGGLENAAGRVSVGPGFLFFKEPDQEPMRVDEISGGFRWDVAARRFEIERMEWRSGRTHLALDGLVTPPDAPDGPWRLSLASGPGAFGALRPGETDIVLARMQIEAEVAPQERSFRLDRFSLHGPDLSFVLSGQGRWREGARHVSLRAEGFDTQARTILRLWPSVLAPNLRGWLFANLLEGRLVRGSVLAELDEAALQAIGARAPLPDGAVRVEYEVADGRLVYLPGAPPLAGMRAKGAATGLTASLVASEGYVDLGARGRIAVAEGRFEAPDLSRRPTPATVTLRLVGSAEAAADLLSREAFKAHGAGAIDPGFAKGQVEARLTIDLRMSKEPGQGGASVRANGQASNVVIERFAGRERLEQGSFSFSVDEAGVRASGQGRAFGAPARIELKKAYHAPGEAVVNLVVDDAARARAGWNPPGLSGPVSARVVVAVGGLEKGRPQVELDFTRATMNGFPPGLVKPAGRAAKASFTLVADADKTTLHSFSFDAGVASAQGQIELDAAGGLVSAKMAQLRLSPGDDMRLDLQNGKDGLRLSVRGASVDARPFVADVLGGGVQGAPVAIGGGGRDEQASRDFDLDLKVSLLNGHNGQSLSNVDMRLLRRGGNLRDLRLSARSGRAAVSGAMLATPAGAPPQFYVRSGDGGALLSFLDLYRRMEGGQLQLVGVSTGARMSGVLSIRDFVLRNEPALRRLLAEGGGGRLDDKALDTSAAQFSRLQGAFVRSRGRLELADGAINGPNIGATIEGYLDFAANQVALNGTFVPAYGVNNLFAKIPLFGPILGGGSNEGLIGVNFRISGPASAPLLTVNPLSAIAPGFLRKIFEAPDAIPQTLPQGLPADPTAQPEPPQATAPSPPRPPMPMSVSPGAAAPAR